MTDIDIIERFQLTMLNNAEELLTSHAVVIRDIATKLLLHHRTPAWLRAVAFQFSGIIADTYPTAVAHMQASQASFRKLHDQLEVDFGVLLNSVKKSKEKKQIRAHVKLVREQVRLSEAVTESMLRRLEEFRVSTHPYTPALSNPLGGRLEICLPTTLELMLVSNGESRNSEFSPLAVEFLVVLEALGISSPQ